MSLPKARVVAVVVGLLVLAWAGFGAARWARTDTRARYRGHHLVAWAVEKKNGAVAGSSRATIVPGQAVELAPAAGYGIRVEAGPIEAVTVTDMRREWKEEHVPIQIQHGRSSSEGTKALTAAFMSLDYGIGEPIA